MSEKQILIKKPMSLLNKELQFDFKDLFGDLSKAAIAGATGDLPGLSSHLIDVVGDIGLKNQPEEIAWELIVRSLIRTIEIIVANQFDLLRVPSDLEELTEEIKFTFLVTGLCLVMRPERLCLSLLSSILARMQALQPQMMHVMALP